MPSKDVNKADQTDTEDEHRNSDQASETPTRDKRKKGLTLPKIILFSVSLLLGAASLLLILGPNVSPRGSAVLQNAFVHGAVTNIGIPRNGRIESLDVDLGDAVKSGDIIARLETHREMAEAATEQARIESLGLELEAQELADSAQEQKDLLNLEAARADLAVAQARLVGLEEQLRLEEISYIREIELLDRGVSTETRREKALQEFTSIETNVLEATANLNGAQNAVSARHGDITLRQVRTAEREVMRSRIRQAELRLAEIRQIMNSASVDAKADGIVVSVSSRPGSSIRPNDTIVTLWNTDEIWMQAWVSESEVALINVGDGAVISIDALSGRTFPGTVNRILVAKDGQQQNLPGEPISPLLPDESRFAVQVEFKPEDEDLQALLPGMSGKVEIELEGQTPRMFDPRTILSALQMP